MRKGFTLIELLVVVVIIGILASVALPSFVGAQDKARNSAVKSNLNAVKLALEQYAADENGAYPAPAGVLAAAGGGGGNRKKKSKKCANCDLDGLEDYLPGDGLPKSPWSNQAQLDFIKVGSTLSDGRDVVDGDKPLSRENTQISASGSIANPPSQLSHYGAIAYSYHEGAQVYALYGTGKKGRAAIVAGAISNAGQ